MSSDEHSERRKSGRARGATMEIMVFFPPGFSASPLCSSEDIDLVSHDAAQTPLLALADDLAALRRRLLE
jgi:hypothetical protein